MRNILTHASAPPDRIFPYRKYDIFMRYAFQTHRKAVEEYDGFLDRDRSTAFDVGNHFGILEEIVRNGLAEGLTPVHSENGCDIHLFFGNRVQMFVARHETTLLLAHLSSTGTQRRQATALRKAIDRSREHFGL